MSVIVSGNQAVQKKNEQPKEQPKKAQAKKDK